MDVEFRKTGERRYGIVVRRDGFPDVEMNPAPGYDPRMPHDLLHFIIESELDLALGVFGQLAAGGHAGTFRKVHDAPHDVREARRQRRAAEKRSTPLMAKGHDDAVLSERVAAICDYEWKSRSDDPPRRAEARERASFVTRMWGELSPKDRARLTPEAVRTICDRLDEVSAAWTRLGVGDHITLSW